MPFAYKPGDVDGDYDFDVDDVDALVIAYNASSYNVLYDEDLDGTFDTADITAFATASGSGSHGRGEVSTYQVLHGYAGYLHEPDLAGAKWHVRNRVYLSEIGRWSKRDPLGYVVKTILNLYSYSQMKPVVRVDPWGQASLSLPLGHEGPEGAVLDAGVKVPCTQTKNTCGWTRAFRTCGFVCGIHDYVHIAAAALIYTNLTAFRTLMCPPAMTATVDTCTPPTRCKSLTFVGFTPHPGILPVPTATFVGITIGCTCTYGWTRTGGATVRAGFCRL